LIKEDLIGDDVVASELCKKRRRSCRQHWRRGGEELTMFESESNLELGLDSDWIQLEET